MFAKATIVGRTGSDIVLRQGNSNVFATVNVAVDYHYTNGNGAKVTETSWLRVLLSGKNAENTAKYCGKGSIVAIAGRLRQRVFTKDGQERSVIEVVAEDVSFVSTKAPESAAQSAETTAPAQATSPAQAPAQTPSASPARAASTAAQTSAPNANAAPAQAHTQPEYEPGADDDAGASWAGVPF